MNNLLKFHNSREYADRMKPLNDKRFANSSFKTGPLHSKEFKILHYLWNCHTTKLFSSLVDPMRTRKIFLKLSMADVFGTTKTELKPIVIHCNQNSTVEGCNFIKCLAISPDDRRIITGGFGGKVLVHDIQRYFTTFIPFLYSFHCS